MKGFFYFCGKLKTISLSWCTYLQPDMKTATLLGDKKLENEAISLLKSCLINHQLPLLVVRGGGFIGADAPFNPDREHIYMLKYDHEAISEAIREYQMFLILR